MSKYTALIVMIFICAPNTFSQDGTPFITHFKGCKEIETQNWSISQDKENVMLFANRRGIMSFDGQNWHITKIPYIPFALKKAPTNEIVYVGAKNNYGFLEKNSKGVVEYKSLSSDTSDIGIISRIIFTDSTVFFYGSKTITRHSLNNPQNIKRWESKEGKPFTGMFVTNKNTFINVAGEGLYRLESDTLFPIVTGFYTEDSEILFYLPYNKQKVLVGTDRSELYTFDGIKYYNYNINDDGYLKESILADGQIISDTLYAFGTLYGGVEIVNKKTGKIVYTVNYQNGLPDDEIYSLGLDNNNGLWVSHEFGVSRVDFELPIRNYTIYPGLKGNLISSVWHNDELYVATSEGVFYLSEVKDYNEVSVWVKTKARKIRTSPLTEKSDINKQAKENETKRPVKKLFSRLFNKEEKEPVKKETTSKANAGSIETKPRYIKKTVSTLKSINYIFKKIDGLSDKCTQLISTKNGILAASNTGLYFIDEHKANAIIKNKYINQITEETAGNKFFIATNTGLFSVFFEDNKWQSEFNFIDFNEPVYSINIIDGNKIWLGSNNYVYSFLIDSIGFPKEFKNYTVDTDYPEKYRLDFVNDSLLLFLESNIYYYNTRIDSFALYLNNAHGVKYILNQQSMPWLKSQHQWSCANHSSVWSEQELAYLKLFENISSIISDKKNNLWIIDNNNQILKISHSNRFLDPDFNIFFNSIINEQEEYFELTDLNFSPDVKTINLTISAPYYIKKNSTEYQYFVEGLMNDWTKWNTNQDINIMIKSGSYTVHVRARNIWGNKSEIKSLKFTVESPFTETIWFYVFIGIVVILLFFTVSKIRERKHLKDKKILEQKVKERTIEIQKQKEDIEAKRDQILLQRDEIFRQKEEITDSINYASRIQNAVLPMREHFEKTFKGHFIIFKPRDIVSGDFYWIAEDDEKVYFTAADCTGHGVPGAFMSMLGITSLNEIFVNRNDKLTAGKVLTLLREKIKFSLHQTGKEGENKDGMDMALCILHKKNSLLEFAGAYNPLYLIRNGQLQEYKADRMPIGIYHVEKEHFTNHEIELKKDDVIYIFSDGYIDQFGGPTQTKFKSSNLKKLLLEIYKKPMEEQKKIMEDRFEKWKGKLDQIDDVIFIGIKF